ncbi:MAG: hypothetical protein NTZ97_00940 [Candidatus Moranbacteria bacterium]|nr:hypothetical protein [Candidatus Moranbacteria bacterium]
MKKIFFLAIVVFAFGCSPKMMVKNVNSPTLASPDKSIDILIEPFESVGLKITESIKKGEVTIVPAVFPEILFGEYYPGRIRWNGWCVTEDGREFFCQFLFSGIDECGGYYAICIIDGVLIKGTIAGIFLLSTLADYGYDLKGNEFEIQSPMLQNQASYRKSLAFEKGTDFRKLQTIPSVKLLETIKLWNNNFKSKKGGFITTPLGKVTIKNKKGNEEKVDQIEIIAGINPQYTIYQKWVAETRGRLSDPIASVSTLAIETYRSVNGSIPSKGVDFKSIVPMDTPMDRRELGVTIKFALDLKQRLINYYLNNTK